MITQKPNLGPLRNSIDKKAYELFRIWTKNAKADYPDFDFNIDDESRLVEDLHKSLCEALSGLKEHRSSDKGKNDNWSVGFLRGFIEGNLNARWYNRHILKTFTSYKNALWLKTIITYLEVDKETVRRINRLYKAYLDWGFPFDEIPKDAYDEADIMSHRVIADLDWEKNWHRHKPYLQKLLDDDFQRVLAIDKQNYLPALEQYFTSEMIIALIAANDPLSRDEIASDEI